MVRGAKGIQDRKDMDTGHSPTTLLPTTDPLFSHAPPLSAFSVLKSQISTILEV